MIVVSTPSAPYATIVDAHGTVPYEIVVQGDRWPMHVIQDTLAFGVDIPIRLLCRNRLANLWSLLEEEKAENLRKLFASRQDFEEKATQLVINYGDRFMSLHGEPTGLDSAMPPWELTQDEDSPWMAGLKYVEEKIWVSPPSNEFLLLREFRQSPSWRLWEMLWLYRHVAATASTTHDKWDTVFGIPGLCMTIRSISPFFSSQGELLLVAGPLLKPSDRRTGNDFHDQRVKPAIDFYKKFVCDAVSRDKEERMTLAGHFRLPMALPGITHRMKQVADTLGGLAQLTIPGGYRELRQCDHASLAELALYLVAMDLPELAKELFFRVDHSIASEGTEGSVMASRKSDQKKNGENWVAFRIQQDSTKLHLCAHIPDASKCIFSPCRYVAMVSGTYSDQQDDLNAFLSRLEEEVQELSSRIYARKKAYEMELLGMMQEHFNESFGKLTTTFGAEASRTKLFWDVCIQITEIVGSDMAAIYRYDYPTCTLETLYVHYIDPEMGRQWGTMKEFMAKAGIDEKSRKQSICYRTIDDPQWHLCRAYHPDDQTCDPKNEPLLPAPFGIKSARSAIAAPMTVFGRTWGVLEVNGMRPYQFRWADGILINQVARRLSQFLYHQDFLSQLHQINQQIVGAATKDLENLSEVSGHLSRIFMSHGASLWLLDPGNDKRYHCRGVYNRSDMASQLRNAPDSVWFLSDNSQSLSASVVTGPELWRQWRMGRDGLQAAWQRSFISSNSSRLIIMPYGMDHLTVVRIRAAKEAKSIATLSLYNSSDDEICYADEWRDLLEFITGHVALLLEAVNSQQNMERTQRRYIQHELKQRILVLSSRGEVLERMADKYQRSPKMVNEHRFREVLKDLVIYSRYVSQTVAMLAERQFTAALRAGKHPVILDSENRIKNEPPETVDLKESFSVALGRFFPMTGREDVRTTRINNASSLPPPPRPVLDPHRDLEVFRIRIHPLNLHTILDNLLDNAIKYADRKYTECAVVGRFKKLPSGAQFTLWNIAPDFRPGELERLTENGFRSSWAEDRFPKDGTGQGLFVVHQICELYSIDFQYEVESHGTFSEHIPTLVFPETMIIQRRYPPHV